MVIALVQFYYVVHPPLDGGAHRAGWDLIIPVSSVPGTAKGGILLSVTIGKSDWHRPGGHTGVKRIHPEGILIGGSLANC